jgi:hypothetical protein
MRDDMTLGLDAFMVLDHSGTDTKGLGRSSFWSTGEYRRNGKE